MADSWARDLYDKYMNYYCTVYFGFLVEAVQNAIDDGYEWGSIDELHKIIKANYI